jgi:hypothetical protein
MATLLTEREYEDLKKFFAFYTELYMSISGLPAELHPVACLEQLEIKGRAAASRGLRLAITDIMEHTRHLNGESVERIDAKLREADILSLSEVRRRFSKAYARVVKRGRIGSEPECYMIQSVLNDQAARISDSERNSLAAMVSDFEQRLAGRGPRSRPVSE